MIMFRPQAAGHKPPGTRTGIRGVSVGSVLVLSLLTVAVAMAADPVEFRRQFVDARYGQVHVLVSRPAAAEPRRTPMAFLAPTPRAGRYYRLFMAELARDRIMIAPDYPGLGESDPPPAMPDMAGYAGAMADTLEALGFGGDASSKVDVCGYHTGAFVAMELAVARPDLVNRLVLVGVPYYTGEERERLYAENVVEQPLDESFAALEKWWKFTVTDREEGVSLERGYDNFVDVLKPKYRHHWPYHAVFSYPAGERAGQVRQPVLLLNTHGSLEENTRAIAALFTDAKLIELPGLHHGVFDVGATELAAQARGFLDPPPPAD